MIRLKNLLVEQDTGPLGLGKKDDILVGGMFGGYDYHLGQAKPVPYEFITLGPGIGSGLYKNPTDRKDLVYTNYQYIISKKDRKTVKKIKLADFENDNILDKDKVNPNSKYWQLVPAGAELTLAVLNDKIGSLTDLGRMKLNPTPEKIAEIIRQSTHWLNDKEADAETAFMMIRDQDTYFKVKKLLGESPFQFVKNFMNTNKVYNSGVNSQSINASMKRLKLFYY
jgi:hypothetical protein